MPCPSCNTPVASSARFCPKCGHRFTHPFVAALAVLLGLCGVLAMIQLYSSQPTAPAAPKTAQQIGQKSAPDPKVKAVADRKEYADTLERHLLSTGLDAHVRVIGPHQDTLRISWALMSRPVVYNMISSDGMNSQVPQLGFRKVIFTDDGSFSGLSVETWTYRWDGAGWK